MILKNLYLRNSAIKFKNGEMKNGFSVFNFPIKTGNWKLKNFYHFTIFNFESKLKYLKMTFSIPILKWKLNGTFGALVFDVLSLNFSIETKIKTLFLISYFNISKNRNGTLGTRIVFACAFIWWLACYKNRLLNFTTNTLQMNDTEQ